MTASSDNDNGHQALSTDETNPILRWMHRVMRVAAYVLAAAMVAVIRVGVVSVIVATAIMAIARKVIILETGEYEALELIGIGVIVVALGAAYWLISLADAYYTPGRAPSRSPSALLPGSKAQKADD